MQRRAKDRYFLRAATRSHPRIRRDRISNEAFASPPQTPEQMRSTTLRRRSHTLIPPPLSLFLILARRVVVPLILILRHKNLKAPALHNNSIFATCTLNTTSYQPSEYAANAPYQQAYQQLIVYSSNSLQIQHDPHRHLRAGASQFPQTPQSLPLEAKNFDPVTSCILSTLR